MTDPAIIEASYAAERNYTHNPDDVIDPSGAVLAIGTEKVDTTTLKDRSPENNNATIKGPMPTEGFIQGRRFTAANENYLDCGSGNGLDNLPNGDFSISALIEDEGAVGAIWETIFGKYNGPGWMIRTIGNGVGRQLRIDVFTDGTDMSYRTNYGDIINRYQLITVNYYGNTKTAEIFINGIEVSYLVQIQGTGNYDSDAAISAGIGSFRGGGAAQLFNGNIVYTNIFTSTNSAKQDFNTFAILPFWSVNYTDYPDNVAEYTDNLPYSSSIISSGTFKVDDDKLQCVSAGTMTYSASYEFDGSEYIKIVIGDVEYAGTGTITVGNTTVEVTQGSNKITITMGTADTIGEIGIQFREEV